jgi:glycosyltransferase involved in cell wall biosynthesis
MHHNSNGRLLFDVSTAMRWTGPPVGIVRVERELALWAHANLPNLAFVFFDPMQLAYCEILPDVTLFLRGEAAVDTLGLTNAALPGQRRTDRIPPFIKPGLLWIIQSRRMALRMLERIRLRTPHASLGKFVDRLQHSIMSRKYRKYMVRNDGTRRPFFPFDMAVGSQIDLHSTDTLICAGSGWGLTNIEALSDVKLRICFRMVLLCYDLIPLLRPDFYCKHDVEVFRNYMHRALAIADLIIVTSRKTEEDCLTYCARHQIANGKIVVAPLGFDVRSDRLPHISLPNELDRGRFVLMVSTIEPRKGHRLLYRVWRRLIDEGAVQTNGFKLVFVGRLGWMTDDLLAEIRSSPAVAERMLIITDADDDLLAALYAGAAFCVYPSEYEGYGLPVVEAFAHGKAVLASSGGALPELVRDLSPCLDPTDDDAWYRTIKQWIECPQERVPFEQAIEQRFQHPTWSAAAANFFLNAVAVPAP